MIAESTVQPEMFWIRKIQGNILYLRVRWDVHQEERTNMEKEPYQMWICEEQEILHKLPDTIDVRLASGMERYWKLDDGIAMKRLLADVQNKIQGYLVKHKTELLSIATHVEVAEPTKEY